MLIATDVAARGLDVPTVDLVVNYDLPRLSKDYVHRVGRTARAGRTGRSLAFVTHYDIEAVHRIDHLIQRQVRAPVNSRTMRGRLHGNPRRSATPRGQPSQLPRATCREHIVVFSWYREGSLCLRSDCT